MADLNNKPKNGPDDNNRTIMLIHGLWMTPKSWENFIERFQMLGYNVTAPPWPGHEGDIEDIRRNASEKIADLSIADVIEHYKTILATMDEQPIIIGHSFGGLVTQVLIDQGLGAAGVGLDAAAPKGVHKLTYAELKSAFPVLSRPGNRHKAVALTFEQFHYGFANNMSETDAKNVYDSYAIPDTGKPIFESLFDDFNRNAPDSIDYNNNNRNPLLLIAGENDHTVPAAVTKSNYDKYSKSDSITDFHEFKERSHLIMLERGWEEVVDYIDNWITKTLK
jgi:pimeloyl-ACP methyl ester carboxylesterase